MQQKSQARHKWFNSAGKPYKSLSDSFTSFTWNYLSKLSRLLWKIDFYFDWVMLHVALCQMTNISRTNRMTTNQQRKFCISEYTGNYLDGEVRMPQEKKGIWDANREQSFEQANSYLQISKGVVPVFITTESVVLYLQEATKLYFIMTWRDCFIHTAQINERTALAWNLLSVDFFFIMNENTRIP